MRIVFALALLIIAPSFALAGALRGEPRAVQACTGGMAPFEALAAETEVIFLARAVLVGDSTHRAPAALPTATPGPNAATAADPASPARQGSAASAGFDLTGVGVILHVERVLVGSVANQIELDWDARSAIEQQLRRQEAGLSADLGSCGIGAFVPRYVAGATYLLFMNDYEGDLTPWGALRVDGPRVLLNDTGLKDANNGFLYMNRSTYDAYFSGILVNEDRAVIVAEAVPLATVLRAIAGLRGDPSIAPPDTGNAGLAAGRY